jgi:hypothetical protein
MKTRSPNATVFFALVIGASFLVQIGCAPKRFSTGAHFDTTYDFAAVERFAFDVARPKVKESANGRILEEALRKGLVDRGFVEKTKEDADVLLSYDLGAYASASLSGRSSLTKRDGGINVWVYDRKTGHQIWYGWSERPLSPQDQPEPVINDAVQAIFENRMPRNQ